MKFSINCVKLEGEYYDSIVNNIIKSYNELYENTNVVYKKNFTKYRFHVYSDVEIIIDKHRERKPMLLCTYGNIDAIEGFSDLSMEEYLKKYDYSKNDYQNKMKEFLNEKQIMCKLCNMEVNCEIKNDNNNPITYSFFIHPTDRLNNKKYQVSNAWVDSYNNCGHICFNSKYDNLLTEKEYNKMKDIASRFLLENYDIH